MLDQFDGLFHTNTEPQGVAIAVVIIFVVGFVDDIRDIPPPAKVTGTVLAGVALVWFGVTMYFFRVPFYDVIVLSPDWKPLVTVLWLLVMTQAINLIDGLDGLAAGIVAIGAGAFFLYSHRLEELQSAVGAEHRAAVRDHHRRAVPRLPAAQLQSGADLHGRRRRLLLGLLMAVSTSVVGGRADENTQAFVGQTFFFLAPLVIPLLILGVPIVDTLFAIVRRTTRRQAIDVADKGHLHHRLMNLGHGHRRSVLILWTWTAPAVGVRALSGAHQREPDLPPVRHRCTGDRVVHRLPPERPPPHQRRPLTHRTVCFR